ncbi:hypothetical protein [Microbacterium hominis]|nr:hypothetical protein [Microbacterium hominis]
MSIMNICTVHEDAHHWDEEQVEDGIVRQRCACGETRTFREEPETIAEEDARLLAEQSTHEQLVSARIAELENEGIGDALHGALDILLNPAMVPAERRAAEIAAHVLRIIAERDVAHQTLHAPDLSRIDRVEVIDGTGRAFARRYEIVGASLAVQDDGGTLKVLAGGRAH